jgi:hypothetical protein
MRSFNDNLNTYSNKESNQNFPTINESPTYRILSENPLTRSLDVDKLGAIDKKFKLNVALRKSNQRLLKNVDFQLLTKIMQKDIKSKGRPKDKLIHINDYNIKENAMPNKDQIMLIPQRPSMVFD